MKVLGAELRRADDAFDQVAYDEVIKKICKLNSKLYRSGRYYDRLFFWVIFVLLLVLFYVVYLIMFAGDIFILF